MWGYDFFVSYNQASAERYAVGLAERLRKNRYDVFLDNDEIAAGESLSKTVNVALRKTQRLVVVAGERATVALTPTRS